MKWIVVILLFFIPQEEPKKDTCEVKLKKVQIQQNTINKQLDSLWIKMGIDTTLRKRITKGVEGYD